MRGAFLLLSVLPYRAFAAACWDNDRDGFDDIACGGDDCDDTLWTVCPTCVDLCGNGRDDDCDGLGHYNSPGPGGYLDDDADGLLYDEEQSLGFSDCDVNAICYVDADLDGYGAGAPVRSPTQWCDTGFSPVDTDCDDQNPYASPGWNFDQPCTGVDEDCDPSTPDRPDEDGDGYSVCDDDCRDHMASVHPGAAEVVCNGIDDDCDKSTVDAPDQDRDGLTACAGDCDDTDPARPATEEVHCNGIDDDCQPTTLDDPDEDGDGLAVCFGDCDDTDPAVPGVEVSCNGIDDDCDSNTVDCVWHSGEPGTTEPAETAADTGLAPPPAGCGCQPSGGGAGGAVGVLFLLGVLRRRSTKDGRSTVD